MYTENEEMSSTVSKNRSDLKSSDNLDLGEHPLAHHDL
jgi:hypothetical protein